LSFYLIKFGGLNNTSHADGYVVALVCKNITVCSGCVSEPKPTCGVITSPPIRGQNVTLSCSMTYRHLTENRHWPNHVGVSASINWDSAAGKLLSNSSTHVTNRAGNVIGRTLHVEVIKLAITAGIPSYSCTTVFHFADKQTQYVIPALNDVSWTCVSEPVFTWCMYICHDLGYFRE